MARCATRLPCEPPCLRYGKSLFGGLLSLKVFLGIALMAVGLRTSTDPSKTGVVLTYTLAITSTLTDLIATYARTEQELNAVERLEIMEVSRGRHLQRRKMTQNLLGRRRARLHSRVSAWRTAPGCQRCYMMSALKSGPGRRWGLSVGPEQGRAVCCNVSLLPSLR
jgi:hypothetical protein